MTRWTLIPSSLRRWSVRSVHFSHKTVVIRDKNECATTEVATQQSKVALSHSSIEQHRRTSTHDCFFSLDGRESLAKMNRLTQMMCYQSWRDDTWNKRLESTIDANDSYRKLMIHMKWKLINSEGERKKWIIIIEYYEGKKLIDQRFKTRRSWTPKEILPFFLDNFLGKVRILCFVTRIHSLLRCRLFWTIDWIIQRRIIAKLEQNSERYFPSC